MLHLLRRSNVTFIEKFFFTNRGQLAEVPASHCISVKNVIFNDQCIKSREFLFKATNGIYNELRNSLSTKKFSAFRGE